MRSQWWRARRWTRRSTLMNGTADDMIRMGCLRTRRALELALLFLVSGRPALAWAQGTDVPPTHSDGGRQWTGSQSLN